MKHQLIWLQGGLVSQRWTVPLIGQSSEHNFRRVERDISCLCKLFWGILVLYINSKRLGSQAILSQSALRQWAVLQQLNICWLLCLLHSHTCHFKVQLVWQLSNWHCCTCFASPSFFCFGAWITSFIWTLVLRGFNAFILGKCILCSLNIHKILCSLHQSDILNVHKSML